MVHQNEIYRGGHVAFAYNIENRSPLVTVPIDPPPSVQYEI